MVAMHLALSTHGGEDISNLKFDDRAISLTFPGNKKSGSSSIANYYFKLNHEDAYLIRSLGYCAHDDMTVDRIEVAQYMLENPVEAGFLYSSIVTNSIINQKQSRLLACLPIVSKTGYNYYEVNNPIYRPLSVHSFTDIHFALTDVHGKVMEMEYDHSYEYKTKNDFPTILTLHIRKIM